MIMIQNDAYIDFNESLEGSTRSKQLFYSLPRYFLLLNWGSVSTHS